MPDDNTTSLTPDAKEYIRSLIRRYAIWFGLTLLALNIAAGAGTILAFWSNVYSTAKQEYKDKLTSLQEQYQTKFDTLQDQYQTKLDTLQQRWDADKTLLTAELKAEHQKQLKSLEDSVNAKFNYDYVKQKLTDVTLTAGNLETETKASAAKANKAAKNAEATSEEAQQLAKDALTKAHNAIADCETAQKKAKDALATAENISKEIANTLKTIQTDDVELAESIKVMIALMKDDKTQPLSKLNLRLETLEQSVKSVASDLSKYADGSKSFNRLVTQELLLNKDGNSTHVTPGRVTVTGKSGALSSELFAENRGDGVFHGGVKVRANKWNKAIAMDENGGVNTTITKGG